MNTHAFKYLYKCLSHFGVNFALRCYLFKSILFLSIFIPFIKIIFFLLNYNKNSTSLIETTINCMNFLLTTLIMIQCEYGLN